MRHLVAALALLAWSTLAPAQSAGTWLNAGELGASGSKFATPATTTAGARQVTVKDVGDFKVGQGVMVSRCNVHTSYSSLWGPRAKYSSSGPLKDLAEVRGYDGSQGSWLVLILDIDRADPLSFRWTDDLGRNWRGGGTKITFDWQPLANGLEVRFKPFTWADGYSVVISYRDQLLSTIEKIEGQVLTLKDPANRSAGDAVVRHNDGLALQAAIDRAIAEKKNLYLPVGCYRLAKPLTVANAGSLTIQGASSVDTVLDISEGEGACVSLRNGTEVTLRDLAMLGHTGYADRDQCGVLRTFGGTALWGFYYKFCAALHVSGTERVLVENCHARRMSGECFYSGGPGRRGDRPEPKQYSKAITYLRCSVEDCGRNAFNNNDFAENTRVLQCRIRDVGGCSWEGASRFVQFSGNYVRNGGTVAMGNIRSRDASFEILPSGQHIVADNVFEEGVNYGGCAVRAAGGATQVIIKHNLFVNFGTSAVEISGHASDRELPAGQSLISGNLFDMTAVGQFNLPRHAVMVSGSQVTVSDNQVLVRGEPDAKVTGVRLSEPAVDLDVHDNLIRGCGVGLAGNRLRSVVSAVVDARSFRADSGRIPLERRRSHGYRGWNLVWFRGSQPAGTSVIEAFDADQAVFRLTAPREVKVGDAFEVFGPRGPGWTMRANTITDCLSPVVLDVYGGPTTIFADNLVSRGATRGVKQALELRGAVQLERNRVSGFNEAGAAALALWPDALGQPPRWHCRDNVFSNCTAVVAENAPGLWAAGRAEGNQFVDCQTAPPTGGAASKTPPPTAVTPLPPPAKALLRAPAPPTGLAIDGAVEEWPWSDQRRVVALEQSPQGGPSGGPKSFALAACDRDWLYLAIRVVTPPNYRLQPATAPYGGDGMEVAFQSGTDAVTTPIFMLYGSANGSFWPHPAGGASAGQMATLEKQGQCATKAGRDQWTAEWRLPLSVLGPQQAQVKRLRFNLGLFHKGVDQWIAWVGTGAEIFRVESAGEIVLER